MELAKLRLYQLHKQNLLKKEKKVNYLHVLKDHIGFHSTDYLTPYISLWSRVEDFDPVLLFKAINEKDAVRLRAMRRTVFVSHKENLPVLLPAICKVLEPHKQANIKHLIKMGMAEDLPDKISENIIKLLEEKSFLTTRQIKKELSNKYSGDFIRSTITLLEFDCIITRIGQRYITDKTINFGLFSKHYPELKEKTLESNEAIKTLFLKYLKQFGPACLDDFCWWLPIKKTFAKQLLADLQDKLVELDFNERKYYLLKDDFQKYEAFDYNINEPMINFLPYEDHFPKAYKIRDWYLSEEVMSELNFEGVMFLGQIRPSIWINGDIKGRWEINWLDAKKTKAEIILEYIHDDVKKSAKLMKLIETEQMKLEHFFNDQLIPIMKL